MKKIARVDGSVRLRRRAARGLGRQGRAEAWREVIEPVTFFVSGHARTKGSTKAFVVGKRAMIVNDNPRTKEWQRAVADKARASGVARALGPVDLVLTFYFARPAAHYGTGKNAAVLKPSAPRLPTSHHLGDIDKIVRPVLDALTSIAYVDDSQVVGITAVKRYAAAAIVPGRDPDERGPGVDIVVKESTA